MREATVGSPGAYDRRAALMSVWRAGDSRVRHGRMAGVLFVLAAAYGGIVLPSLPQVHVHVQLGLIVSAGVTGAVCWFLPWARWPEWATLVPAAVGAVMLTVGSAGFAGVLEHYVVCISALFAYVGLTQSARSALAVGAASEVALAGAVLLGRQDTHVVELLLTVAVLSVVAALTASVASQARDGRRDIQLVHTALTRLVAAADVGEGSQLLADMTGDLLHADGANVMLSEYAGSDVFTAGASAGQAKRMPRAVIDVSAEQSGIAVAARTGRLMFIADAPSSPVVAQRFVQQLGVQSVLYIPIPGEGGVLGVIVVFWTRRQSLDDRHDSALGVLSIQAGHVLERLRAMSTLDAAASTDPLTGLGNRRGFLTALEQMSDGGGLLVFDLDGFKRANDDHGHLAGDRVLVDFARDLSDCVRGDTVCRIGGDEFAVVMSGEDPRAAEAVLRRLSQKWERPYGVTYSHGCAPHRAGDPPTVALGRADAELYKAKRAREAAAR